MKFQLVIATIWFVSAGLQVNAGHPGIGLMFVAVGIMYLTIAYTRRPNKK